LAPEKKININRVGVESVKLILQTNRKDGLNVLYPNLNIYIDLPLNQKAAHTSRNIESLNEILDEVKKKPIRYLENFCSKISKRLLKKHNYSTRAIVQLKSDYYLSRKSPLTDSLSGESCTIYASAIAYRNQEEVKVRKFIGAEIIALTYCPCLLNGIENEVQNYLIKKEGLENSKVKKILKNIPLASHNQRCKIFTLVETSNRSRINIDDLIEILETSASSPTYSLLKRIDEIQMIKNAYNKPMFVEDVLREVLYKIISKNPKIPDNFTIKVKVTSEESIHKYNLISEHETKAGTLKETLKIK
ncbi:MAG: GTP cyclohydrolase MptA, partial [Candidatus Odinarchaeia archaeon]